MSNYTEPCDICGHDKWSTLLEHRGPSVCSGSDLVRGTIPLTKVICDHCGFVRTATSPLDEDLDGYYRDVYAVKLEDKDFDFFNFNTGKTFGDTLNEFVLSHSFPTNGSLLDIGCGKGFFERAFSARYPEWRAVGVDPNVRSIELARVNAPTAEFHLKKFDASDFEASSFDLVCMHTLLNRVPLRAVLSDAVRLCKDGGVVSIAVALFPNAEFELYFADHINLIFPEHLHALGAELGLHCFKESQEGSIGRFLFRKEESSHPVAAPGEGFDARKEHIQGIVSSWKTTVTALCELGEERQRLAVYGAGTTATILLALAEYPGDCIAAVFDDTPSKAGRQFGAHTIAPMTPAALADSRAETVLLAAGRNAVPIMKEKVGSGVRTIHV